MAGTGGGDEQWKVGLLIAAFVVAGGGAGWGLFMVLGLPFEIIGAIIGSVLAFVLFSYVYYGR